MPQALDGMSLNEHAGTHETLTHKSLLVEEHVADCFGHQQMIGRDYRVERPGTYRSIEGTHAFVVAVKRIVMTAHKTEAQAQEHPAACLVGPSQGRIQLQAL